MANTKVTYFKEDGTSNGGAEIFIPDYLDWMPIRLKVFWFLERGLGEPSTKHVLFASQGEQMLMEVKTPLQNMHFHKLKEIDNGLESKVREYASENNISRVPRNQ